MSNLWIAVAISVVSAMVYVWFSVSQSFHFFGEGGGDRTENRNKRFILLPIIFIVLAPIGYFYLGNAEKQEKWQLAVKKMNEIQSGNELSIKESDIQDLVLALRSSIAQEPQNGQLWFMLAENYFKLRMVDLADAAMQKALSIEQRPDWFVANAQILSVRSSASDISQSINLLQNALSIQPEHQSALLTLGFVYFKQQQYEFAIGAWRKLLTLLESSGSDTRTIQRQIDFAEQKLNAKKVQTSD